MNAENSRNPAGGASNIVLGITAGVERYLVPMIEVQEIISLQKITKIPLAQPWFAGLINVRGHLYSVTDLGEYLGNEAAPFTQKSRIMLIASDRLALQSGFMVNSMLGIRNRSEFKQKISKARKRQKKSDADQLVDAEGRIWREISLSQLMMEEKFLQAEIAN